MKHVISSLLVISIFGAFIISCNKDNGDGGPVDTTPELIRVTPDNGGVGDLVKIVGKNFSMKNKENIILFGEAQAEIDFSYTDTLIVYVPAQAGNTISVTVKGIPAKNTLSFNYKQSIAVRTIAGGEGGVQTTTTANASAKFFDAEGFCFDDNGDIYIAESGAGIIKKVSLATGQTSLFAGVPAKSPVPDSKRWPKAVEKPVDGPLLSATFLCPKDIAYVGNGTFYVADQMHNALRKIQNGQVTTVGGCRDEAKDEWNSTGRTVVLGTDAATNKCPLSEFVFARPTRLAFDKANNQLYLSSLNAHYVVRIDLTEETVELVAGKPWNAGIVNGPLGTGRLNCPTGICIDDDQNLYIACDYAHCVVKVDKNKNQTLICGTPDLGGSDKTGGHKEGYPSIGSAEGQAWSELCRPQAVAVDNGKILVADFNHVISVIDPVTYEMKLYCGEVGYNDSIDGGLNTVKFHYPMAFERSPIDGCLWVSQGQGMQDGLRKFATE